MLDTCASALDHRLRGKTCPAWRRAGWVAFALISLTFARSSAAQKPRALQVAAGAEYSCARLDDGSVRCWGENEYGQLGDGTLVARATPVRVVGLGAVVDIALGPNHACARQKDGQVLCWGMQDSGMLGTTNESKNSRPLIIPGLTDLGELKLTTSASWARMKDGTLRAWGRTFDEQIMNLTMRVHVAAIRAPRLVRRVGDVAELAVGNMHTCVRKTDGRVWCWGMNTQGQLGNGTTQPSSEPALVPGLSDVRAIAAGGLASCALTQDGRVFCWGQRAPLTAPATGLSPREIPELRGARQIVLAVQREGGCAVFVGKKDRVLCWGSNEYHQLGDGPKDAYRTSPAAIPDLAGVRQLGLGVFHSCALLAAGSVRCWGNNPKGQLGDGTTAARPRPVPVKF